MSASNTTTAKNTSSFRNIGKSVSKTLKNLGKNLGILKKSKESLDDKIVRELEELPDAPTTNIRSAIKERNSALEKLRRDLKKDIEIQKTRKEELQKISRQVATLKKRENRGLKTNLEKQQEIMKTLKKTGFEITTDTKTLKKLQALPPAPSHSEKTYNVPSNVAEEQDLDEILATEPLPRLPPVYSRSRRFGGKKGRKTKGKK